MSSFAIGVESYGYDSYAEGYTSSPEISFEEALLDLEKQRQHLKQLEEDFKKKWIRELREVKLNRIMKKRNNV